MYVLLLNGFDVKEGRFIEYGFSVSAFVKKANITLPKLRGDRGDVDVLNKAGLWPLPIKKQADGLSDGFYGNIKSVNWPNADAVIKNREGIKGTRFSNRVVIALTDLLSRIIGKRRLAGVARLVLKQAEGEINPTILK